MISGLLPPTHPLMGRTEMDKMEEKVFWTKGPAKHKHCGWGAGSPREEPSHPGWQELKAVEEGKGREGGQRGF